MKLRSKDFILVLGTACAWAQTLLDRSGIIPYGGAAATLDQVTIWASIAISAIICTIIVYFLGAKRGIAFLSITGTLFVFAGCTLLLALNQGIGTDTPTVTNLATLMLAAARAPIIQIWTYYLVINKQAPRLMLLSSVLASCLVLFTTSLPSQDMHLTSYLLASLIGSTLTIIPMSTLRNAAGDSQQKGMFSSIGAKALVLFCVLQILPTFISGSIGAIEMYVPLSLAPWQQIASFASCGLLLALFAYACSAKRLPDTMLSALPILLTLCMVLPLGTAKTFTPKPLFILATQLGGNFEILNIYHTRSRYHTRTAAFVFFGQTLVFFGLFAGSMLASGILSNANIEIIESGFYTSFALGGLLVLLAGLVLLLLKTQSEVRVTPNKLPDTLPESTEQPASFSPNEQAIEKLSKHYRLTSRESDMIGYLLSGYSRQKISQELFIAESTVKSHINNLYTKLDIHKRDELLDLVNEFRNKE